MLSHRRTICLSIIFLLSFYCLIGTATAQLKQGYLIKGVTVDSLIQPFDFSNISLIHAEDSVVFARTISDENGVFEFSSVPEGEYTLLITHLGFKTQTRLITLNQDTDLGAIILQESAVSLGGLVVTNKNIERKVNGYKMSLLNNPITHGKNIFEVLGHLPGVSNFGGLMVNGRNVVEVYIDNRKLNDLTQLNAILANHVHTVEVLNSSDSSYDAQKKGAILKITLIKNPDGGYMGSLGGGVNLNYKFKQFSNNVFGYIGYRYKKLNIYNYTSYSGRTPKFDEITHARYDDIGTASHKLTKDRSKTDIFSNNLSLVYQFNAKHELGLVFDFGLNHLTSDIYAQTSLFDYTNIGLGNTSYSRNGREKTYTYQPVLQHIWQIDEQGSSLETTVDFSHRDNDGRPNHIYKYDYNQQSPSEVYRREKLVNTIDMVDFETKFNYFLNEKSKISSGVRYYYNQTKRDLAYESLDNGTWVSDPQLGDKFNAKGSGFGTYLNFESSSNAFQYSTGLRIQLDQFSHNSHRENLKVTKKYWNFFPSLDLSYELNEGMELLFLASRGMGYIPISEISPTVRYISENFYSKGNPDLEPSTYYNLDLSLTIKKWNLYCAFIHSNDEIMYITLNDPSNPLVKYSMPVNSARSNIIVSGFTGRISPTKWWEIRLSGSINIDWMRMQDQNENKGYNITMFRGGIQNTFQHKDWGGHLNINGETKGKYDDKTMRGVLYMNIGVYKYFLNRSLMVQFAVRPAIKERKLITETEHYRSENYYRREGFSTGITIRYIFNSNKSMNLKQMRNARRIEERSEKTL